MWCCILRTADVFPVVASLPPKNKFFSAGETEAEKIGCSRRLVVLGAYTQFSCPTREPKLPPYPRVAIEWYFIPTFPSLDKILDQSNCSVFCKMIPFALPGSIAPPYTQSKLRLNCLKPYPSQRHIPIQLLWQCLPVFFNHLFFNVTASSFK